MNQYGIGAGQCNAVGSGIVVGFLVGATPTHDRKRRRGDANRQLNGRPYENNDSPETPERPPGIDSSDAIIAVL
jgi:hypothetical protein